MTYLDDQVSLKQRARNYEAELKKDELRRVNAGYEEHLKREQDQKEKTAAVRAFERHIKSLDRSTKIDMENMKQSNAKRENVMFANQWADELK